MRTLETMSIAGRSSVVSRITAKARLWNYYDPSRTNVSADEIDGVGRYYLIDDKRLPCSRCCVLLGTLNYGATRSWPPDSEEDSVDASINLCMDCLEYLYIVANTSGYTIFNVEEKIIIIAGAVLAEDDMIQIFSEDLILVQRFRSL